MPDLNFAGGAVATQLNGSISDSATTIAVDDGSTYPTEDFVIVLGRGTATEEKVLVSARTSNSFGTCTRGYDGTTAVAHADNVVVEHTVPATWFNDANDYVNRADTVNTTINAAGDLTYGTGNDTETRLPIGTAGQVVKVNSGATAPEWGQVGSAGIADGAVTIGKLGLTEFKGRRTSSLAFTNNEIKNITLDTEDVDVAGIHSAGVLTIPTTGLWIVTVGGAVSSGSIAAAIARSAGTGQAAAASTTLSSATPAYSSGVFYAESGATYAVQGTENNAGGSTLASLRVWLTLVMD